MNATTILAKAAQHQAAGPSPRLPHQNAAAFAGLAIIGPDILATAPTNAELLMWTLAGMSVRSGRRWRQSGPSPPQSSPPQQGPHPTLQRNYHHYHHPPRNTLPHRHRHPHHHLRLLPGHPPLAPLKQLAPTASEFSRCRPALLHQRPRRPPPRLGPAHERAPCLTSPTLASSSTTPTAAMAAAETPRATATPWTPSGASSSSTNPLGPTPTSPSARKTPTAPTAHPVATPRTQLRRGVRHHPAQGHTTDIMVVDPQVHNQPGSPPVQSPGQPPENTSAQNPTPTQVNPIEIPRRPLRRSRHRPPLPSPRP